MTDRAQVADAPATVEEIQQGWQELRSRVGHLEAERSALEQENKALRALLERVIEHRQKSHGELVLLLTSLVSKLPLNDVGVIVSRLVEHNEHVSQVLAALIKGAVEGHLPQPEVLQTIDQAKRDLAAAVKPLVDELIQSGAPCEKEMLQALAGQPGLFFSPKMVRANRCFIKGQVARERIVREFGESALVLFNDMTTDPKLNPRPKPDEIVLGFKPDFETLLPQVPDLTPEKRQGLVALYQSVQLSKGQSEQARAQRYAFQRLSFIVDLLHYYENQNTEAPDVVFAQRLPALVEQIAVTGPQDPLDEKSILLAENLLGFVINHDHRLMIINNLGKGGGTAKMLKFVLRLRETETLDQHHLIADFVKLLIPLPPEKCPLPEPLAAVLRLIHPTAQPRVVRAIMSTDRLRKEEAEALGRAVAFKLGLQAIESQLRPIEAIPPEVERQMAWDKIKDLMARRAEPATVAAAIRERLNAKYDADELKQSWIVLTETDPISLIRVVCQLPYLASGKTDAIARPVLETYVTRLMHEKYSATYHKVMRSLKSMFKAKPDAPTLLNFLALVRWVDPEAANRLCADIGMPVAAH